MKPQNLIGTPGLPLSSRWSPAATTWPLLPAGMPVAAATTSRMSMMESGLKASSATCRGNQTPGPGVGAGLTALPGGCTEPVGDHWKFSSTMQSTPPKTWEPSYVTAVILNVCVPGARLMVPSLTQPM